MRVQGGLGGWGEGRGAQGHDGVMEQGSELQSKPHPYLPSLAHTWRLPEPFKEERGDGGEVRHADEQICVGLGTIGLVDAALLHELQTS